MPIADWSDLLPQTVTVKPFSSRDAYGAKTYGTAVSYSARVVYKTRLIKNAAGEEVLSRGQVWLQTANQIGTEDLITLPDATTPIILAAENYADEDGAHHSKVFFG